MSIGRMKSNGSFPCFPERTHKVPVTPRTAITLNPIRRTKMSKVRFTLNALAIVCLTLFTASLASAQATRTWVSGVGDDVNPCSRTAPCKTYAGAISKTAINGEIDTLDPGGFGAVTTVKSIPIDGTYGSGFGAILASGTNGVVINLGGV